jgi:hypothetical protein
MTQNDGDGWISVSSRREAGRGRAGSRGRGGGRGAGSGRGEQRSGSADTASSSQRRGGGQPRSPGGLHPAQLTGYIKGSSSVEELGRLVQQHGSSMNYIHVSAAYCSLAKLSGSSAAKQALADQLLVELLQPLLPQCGERACANVMHAMARMQHCPPGMLSGVLGRLLAQLHAAAPQHLANVIWALATLGSSSPSAAVEAAVAQHSNAVSSLLGRFISSDILPAAIPQHLANVMWALATLGSNSSSAAVGAAVEQHTDAISSLLGRFITRDILPTAKPQELANTLWALATLGSSSSSAAVGAAVKQHADAISRLLGRFISSDILSASKPQDLANVIWALATLGSSSSSAAVEAAVAQHSNAVSRLLARFTSRDILPAAKPQELANTLWALATLGSSSSSAAVEVAVSQHPDAISSLLARFISRDILPAAVPQALANTLWALATLGSSSSSAAVTAAVAQHADAISRLLGRFISRDMLPTAKPQNLANTLWALAVLSEAGLIAQQSQLRQQNALSRHNHMRQLLGAASQAAPSMTPQGVANSIWAASRLRISSDAFAAAMQQAAAQQVKAMIPQDLANTALGAAGLAWGGSAGLVAAMVQEAARRVQGQGAAGSGFTHQGLANLCASATLARLPASEQPLQQVQALCDALAQHWDGPLHGSGLASQDMCQLLQLHMWLQASSQQQLPSLLPQQQLQQCEAAWRQLQATDKSSHLALQVGRAELRQASELLGVQWRITH